MNALCIDFPTLTGMNALRAAFPTLTGSSALRNTLLAALLFAGVSTARAHEGPPFPILVDQPVGSLSVSVWSDPDIGTGTFFVILESTDGSPMPEDLSVEIGVAPASGRLDEVRYRAESQSVRRGARYFAEVEFDEGGMWDVRVFVTSREASRVLTTEVEPTPDGTIGPIGLLVYLLPFLAVGFLWVKAVLRRRAPAA